MVPATGAEAVRHLVEGQIEGGDVTGRIEDERSRRLEVPFLLVLGRNPNARIEQEHGQWDSRSSRISFAASPPRFMGGPRRSSNSLRRRTSSISSSRSASRRRKPLRVSRLARAWASSRSSRLSGIEIITLATGGVYTVLPDGIAAVAVVMRPTLPH